MGGQNKGENEYGEGWWTSKAFLKSHMETYYFRSLLKHTYKCKEFKWRHCQVIINRNSKFWWLDESQHSLRNLWSQFPLPKGASSLITDKGTNGYLWCLLAHQSTYWSPGFLSILITCYTFRVHAGILALLSSSDLPTTLNFLQPRSFPPLSCSFFL